MSISVKNGSGDWVQCAGNGTLYADAPLGTILAYGGSTAPTGWFLCQGQAISRTDYAELFAVIGTSFGSGDGSTTFNIPDLREATTKGVGLSGESNNHYDSAGLTLGEFIDDRVQDHVHNTYLNGDLNYPFGTKDGGDTNIQFANVDRQEGAGWNVKANTIYTGRHGATTEVKAVGVNYIIKARMAAIPADFINEIEEVVEENIVDSVTDGNMRAVTSNAVYDALSNVVVTTADVVADGNMNPVTSNAVYDALHPTNPYSDWTILWTSSGNHDYLDGDEEQEFVAGKIVNKVVYLSIHSDSQSRIVNNILPTEFFPSTPNPATGSGYNAYSFSAETWKDPANPSLMSYIFVNFHNRGLSWGNANGSYSYPLVISYPL